MWAYNSEPHITIQESLKHSLQRVLSATIIWKVKCVCSCARKENKCTKTRCLSWLKVGNIYYLPLTNFSQVNLIWITAKFIKLSWMLDDKCHRDHICLDYIIESKYRESTDRVLRKHICVNIFKEYLKSNLTYPDNPVLTDLHFNFILLSSVMQPELKQALNFNHWGQQNTVSKPGVKLLLKHF